MYKAKYGVDTFRTREYMEYVNEWLEAVPSCGRRVAHQYAETPKTWRDAAPAVVAHAMIDNVK